MSFLTNEKHNYALGDIKYRNLKKRSC